MVPDAGQVELPELQATWKPRSAEPRAAALPQPLPVEAAALPDERAEPRRPALPEPEAAVPGPQAFQSQGPPRLAEQGPVTVVQRPSPAPQASRPEAQLSALAWPAAVPALPVVVQLQLPFSA